MTKQDSREGTDRVRFRQLRYAIYFTPPEEHPLTARAAGWLGRSAFSGERIARPAVSGLSDDEIEHMTRDARRYGFHATLKAPFELAPGKTEAELVDAFDGFAAETEAFEIPTIVVGQLGPFFALVPAERSERLDAFAGDCVRKFEPFRAPLTDADVARRRPENLGPSERENLHRWGYPYVFEDFRFHMTLTDAIAAERQAAVRSVLEDVFSPFIGRPLAISHLALFIEAERGAPFTVKRLKPLNAAARRKTA